nr:DUF2232 domain-containing protein [Planococcus glaciei]
MQNQQTSQLTQGALMAAVFTVLLAISVYVPLLNVVTTLFLAVPIAWYSAKYPWQASALFSVVCLILSAIVGGLLALPIALIHIPLGLVIGLSIYHKKKQAVHVYGFKHCAAIIGDASVYGIDLAVRHQCDRRNDDRDGSVF